MTFRRKVKIDSPVNGDQRISQSVMIAGRSWYLFGAALALILSVGSMAAQVNVLTAHNDIARTGQNLNETLLDPSNVNAAHFGQLFSQSVSGSIAGQPLYVSQVAIPGKGSHNVVYAAVSNGTLYAFDADSNGGANGKPLWKVSLVLAVPGSAASAHSILGTPVIDLSTNTLYIVCLAIEGGSPVFRLHALDIGSGAEKFGGPVVISGSVAGTGNGSVGGLLSFDPSTHMQRPGLLLVNGVVYVAFGSHSDMGSWHGWIFSYKAATLKQLDIYCASPNSGGAGIWLPGAGLAAEVNDSKKPYGRMFVVTGNGVFGASSPYSDSMSYGMSIVNLDLTGGSFTVKDEFTPYNEARLDAQDGDLGSGGAVLLPGETMASGATLNGLVQVGKAGAVTLLDRSNLGGYNASGDEIVQEVSTAVAGKSNGWGTGVWGSPAYWNQYVYVGGSSPGTPNSLAAYSYTAGVLSSAPVSQTQELFGYPAPTPSISANGSDDGILWVLKEDAYSSGGPAVLMAYDATDIDDLLYSSDTNSVRDNPGGAAAFAVPTIANGKVYVGGSGKLSIFGLLANSSVAASPVFTPGSGGFANSLAVSISDATTGAKIYYTTDGTVPTIASTVYAGPFNIVASGTIRAIASADGYLQSAVSSATYTTTTDTADPVFTLAGGSYAGAQTVKISDATQGSTIYFTVDGSTPTTSSSLYTGALTVPVSETVRALATAPGLRQSQVIAAAYTITPAYTFAFPLGFDQAGSQIQFNGSTGLDDFRLQLTNGMLNEAGSAFYSTPVNIQSFTTDFIFQLSNPVADGITFTIQNQGPTAVGGKGAGLGYTTIQKSVAIKFDLLDNQGEGPNSTGIFTRGNTPTMPAINLNGTGIDLHSGDYMVVHITYDGTGLSLTITDQLTGAAWSHYFQIDIPNIVGGNSAYVGFTGSTGRQASSQKLTYWTYLAGAPTSPNYPAGFDGIGLNMNTAVFSGSALQLTNGVQSQKGSAYFATPVGVASFTTDFDFQLANALSDGFTFVIQNAGPAAIGIGGEGLGYENLPQSVAIKFDFYNNAGEGNDSTGVYVNGRTPNVPSIDLSSTGIQLISGDVFHAHIVYDGTTLSWTLTDQTLKLHPSVTNSVAVNIPHTVGGNTAYVGFTGANAHGPTRESILDWTYSNP